MTDDSIWWAIYVLDKIVFGGRSSGARFEFKNKNVIIILQITKKIKLIAFITF